MPYDVSPAQVGALEITCKSIIIGKIEPEYTTKNYNRAMTIEGVVIESSI